MRYPPRHIALVIALLALPGETTSCIGIAGDDSRQARMVILELLE